MEPLYFEEVSTFAVSESGSEQEAAQQYCISIERPRSITLDRVVEGMLKKGGYRHDPDLRRKYAAKVCAVLRLIGKGLRHLHASGGVHGNVCMETCGKFDHEWKLLGRLNVQLIGAALDPSKFQYSFPPEALVLEEKEGVVYDSDAPPVAFNTELVADPSLDIWGFGQLAYESILGKQLVEFDKKKKTTEDAVSLLEVMEWDESNMRNVFEELLDSGIPESGADLIVSCLFPRPADRPKSMDDILSHPFWKEMRRYRERSSKSRGPRGDSQSVYTESSKSIFTETSETYD